MATLADLTNEINAAVTAVQRVSAAATAVVEKLSQLAVGPDVTSELNTLTGAVTDLATVAQSLENAVNPPAPAGG